MNYILSKNKPEVGDKGFIIGNRFVKINGGGYPKYSYPSGMNPSQSDLNFVIQDNNTLVYNEWIISTQYPNVETIRALGYVFKNATNGGRFTSSSNMGLPGELFRYQNVNKKVLIKRYTMGTGDQNGYYNRCVRDYELQGSDDGIDWITIDTQTDLFGTSTPNQYIIKEFEINNKQAFYYHRIWATRNYGGYEKRLGDFSAFPK